jgi:hypothetical protein
MNVRPAPWATRTWSPCSRRWKAEDPDRPDERRLHAPEDPFPQALHLGRNGRRRSPTKIKRAQAAGDPDTGETYYRHWLNALERIVAEKGVTDPPTLARYRDAWDRVADRTPHGTPIELRPEDFAD